MDAAERARQHAEAEAEAAALLKQIEREVGQPGRRPPRSVALSLPLLSPGGLADVSDSLIRERV